VYDRNPRGYFGPISEVDHFTNSDGFRGAEFAREKPDGTARILFLGDSFTFGEGVLFEDTYPEITADLLNRRNTDSPQRYESYNLGVGGYNTAQSLNLLKHTGLEFAPDIIVLGYVPNDPEPSIFELDPDSGGGWRREREVEALTSPPADLHFGVRTAQVVSRFFGERQRSRKLIQHYRSIHDDSFAGYTASRNALHEIAILCRSQQIPCYVVQFPILFRLKEYPLLESHEKVASDIKRAGMNRVDLLPELQGMDASELWVHPADQHPNERVHRIAAEALAQMLEDDMRREK